MREGKIEEGMVLVSTPPLPPLFVLYLDLFALPFFLFHFLLSCLCCLTCGQTAIFFLKLCMEQLHQFKVTKNADLYHPKNKSAKPTNQISQPVTIMTTPIYALFSKVSILYLISR